MSRDHKVRLLRREDIARFALVWWRLADRVGLNFNICTFVTTVLSQKLRDKGKLNLKLYSQEDLPERACVTFNPLTLHIVERIWKDAGQGMSYARYIVAHEIGHIILHDQFAVAFSEGDEARPGYVAKDESAENQANTFADLFLVPDHVALKLRDADAIAGLCVVTDDLAKRRLAEALNAKNPLRLQYEGEMCGGCGNFTLVRTGTRMECDTCGRTTDIS